MPTTEPWSWRSGWRADAPFAYYNRLGRRRQAIYRHSDRINSVRLPRAAGLRPLIPRLSAALERRDRTRVESVCQRLTDGITSRLGVPRCRISVHAVRPSDERGELHGLYRPAEPGRRAVVALWMRTARRKQVVAFKTFLRTLLHEICHHLDYELFELAESFHTEGFYRRESSLFHQLRKP